MSLDGGGWEALGTLVQSAHKHKFADLCGCAPRAVRPRLLGDDCALGEVVGLLESGEVAPPSGTSAAALDLWSWLSSGLAFRLRRAETAVFGADAEFEVEFPATPHPPSARPTASAPPLVLFHGSPLGNWLSILMRGLERRSFTAAMGNGAMFGGGIYLSDSLQVARKYAAAMEARPALQLGPWVACTGAFEVKDDPATLRREADGYYVATSGAGIRLSRLLFYRAHPSSAGLQPSQRLTVPWWLYVLYLFVLLVSVAAGTESIRLRLAWFRFLRWTGAA